MPQGQRQKSERTKEAKTNERNDRGDHDLAVEAEMKRADRRRRIIEAAEKRLGGGWGARSRSRR
jgi:hypothetical protein